MKSKIITFFFLLQGILLSAQTLTINTVEVCAGTEVYVPVTSSSLYNVAAITLYIGFDSTNMTYVSVENIDPQLDGMSINLMSSPTQLAFAWSNTTPVNFPSGKLFDIKFISNGQTGTIQYNPGCEIADNNGTTISASYINGSISSSVPVITSQPHDTVVTEGGTAHFYTSSPNATSFLWRESLDQGSSWIALDDGGSYSGTQTPSLQISPVPLTLNNAIYQCLMTRGICSNLSSAASLHVDALTAVKTLTGALTPEKISAYPVPFTDNTTLSFNLDEPGNALIQVINTLGQIITEIALPNLTEGNHHIYLGTRAWQPGAFFLKFSARLPHENIEQTIQLFKNN